MKNIPFFILVSCSILFCKAQETLKDFYFPFSDNIETKVFKYVDKNDATRIEYWKVTTFPKTNEIKTVSYDSELNIYNIFVEFITEKGAELITFSNFELNEKGKHVEIKSKILDKDVYRWNEDKKYKYSVTFKDKYGRFYFKKERAVSDFETIKVNGETYEVVKFRDDYLTHAIDQDFVERFYQETYYAKDIGMVKYNRKIPNQDKAIVLELSKILTDKEFKKIVLNKK